MFLSNDEDAPLKMIDFGLADYCTAEGHLTDVAGTIYYLAPEVLKQCYSFKADLWSAGEPWGLSKEGLSAECE